MMDMSQKKSFKQQIICEHRYVRYFRYVNGVMSQMRAAGQDPQASHEPLLRLQGRSGHDAQI